MNKHRSRLALLGVLALALCATIGLSAGVAEAAKKKKKKAAGGTVDITKTVAVTVPDATATADGTLASTIDVGGKKFRGTVIRDVNATVQLTGLTPIAIGDLQAVLTAPNGATTFLFFSGLGPGTILGPLTVDDESLLELSSGSPDDPTSLYAPYQGTAQPEGFPLGIMDGGPVTGTWTLRVNDIFPVDTSVFNQWRLNVTAGRPYQTK